MSWCLHLVLVSQTTQKGSRIYRGTPAANLLSEMTFRDVCPCIIDLIGGDQGSL